MRNAEGLHRKAYCTPPADTSALFYTAKSDIKKSCFCPPLCFFNAFIL
ncbi:hypothetical protein HMPREF0658_1612 [Hoylesella marshii DSM 16973 = JCM 13450]|uniref:Uncharacterized protein n=1 Tax=Hoylesella marshii DSM 16973 = JCM 13450 TaxID=862515 RepID=E0NTV9_9BACT|nr:hypothetical protein HMPREF0658_1612 [Hoylesella marshii DSM 16973 = JCM 13450]